MVFIHSLWNLFQVEIPEDIIAQVELHWPPPNHSVCKLVPTNFSDRAYNCWKSIDSPLIDINNVWDTFTQMVDTFCHIELNSGEDLCLLSGNEEREDIELLQRLHEANIHAGLSSPLPHYTLQLERGAPKDGNEDSDDESIFSDIGGGLFVDFSDEEGVANNG